MVAMPDQTLLDPTSSAKISFSSGNCGKLGKSANQSSPSLTLSVVVDVVVVVSDVVVDFVDVVCSLACSSCHSLNFLFRITSKLFQKSSSFQPLFCSDEVKVPVVVVVVSVGVGVVAIDVVGIGVFGIGVVVVVISDGDAVVIRDLVEIGDWVEIGDLVVFLSSSSTS